VFGHQEIKEPKEECVQNHYSQVTWDCIIRDTAECRSYYRQARFPAGPVAPAAGAIRFATARIGAQLAGNVGPICHPGVCHNIYNEVLVGLSDVQVRGVSKVY
jgi:hypothetical protein